jgi:hypothetical protein
MVPRSERILALLLAAGCLAMLVVAASLTPAAAGHGTHEQLGLPACAWAAGLDTPCPTCGMTTAFAAAANRRPLQAVAIQPMGALLALATAALFWGAGHVALFGSRLGTVAGRWSRPRVLWIVAALFAAAWIYKIVTWRHVGGGVGVGA